MTVDLTRLNNDIDKIVEVNFKHTFSSDELKGTDLLKCDVKVIGEITRNKIGEIILDLDVCGKMVLPCALTLKPTDYPYNIKIEGPIGEKTDKNANFFTNKLDIFPIIWENILMEIPMRVVSPGAEDIKLQGDGWSLITEDNVASSPLAELEDLIEEGR